MLSFCSSIASPRNIKQHSAATFTYGSAGQGPTIAGGVLGGAGGVSDKHAPEVYPRDRKKTSRGPIYYINDTGRRHPGDQYAM